MSQIKLKIKDDFQIVLLLSCFMGHLAVHAELAHIEVLLPRQDSFKRENANNLWIFLLPCEEYSFAYKIDPHLTVSPFLNVYSYSYKMLRCIDVWTMDVSFFGTYMFVRSILFLFFNEFKNFGFLKGTMKPYSNISKPYFV